jgi:hypothetical protein
LFVFLPIQNFSDLFFPRSLPIVLFFRRYVDTLLGGMMQSLPAEVISAIAKRVAALPDCMVSKLPLQAVFSSSIKKIRIDDKMPMPLPLLCACLRSCQSGLGELDISNGHANELVEAFSLSKAANGITSLSVVTNGTVDRWTGISPEIIMRFSNLESCTLMNGAIDANTARAVLQLPKLREIYFCPYDGGNELCDPKLFVKAIVELTTTSLESISLRCNRDENTFFEYVADLFSRWEGRRTLKSLNFPNDWGSVGWPTPGIFTNFEATNGEEDTSHTISSLDDIPRNVTREYMYLIVSNINIDEELCSRIMERNPTMQSIALTSPLPLKRISNLGRFDVLHTLSFAASAPSYHAFGAWPKFLKTLGFQFTEEPHWQPVDIGRFFQSLGPLPTTLTSFNFNCYADRLEQDDLDALLARMPKLVSFSINVSDSHANPPGQEKHTLFLSHPKMKYAGLYVHNAETVYGSMPKMQNVMHYNAVIRAGRTHLPSLTSFSYTKNSPPDLETFTFCRTLRDFKMSCLPSPASLPRLVEKLSGVRQLSITEAGFTETQLALILQGMPRLWCLEVGGWHESAAQLPRQITGLDWLKHPTLCKVSVFGPEDPEGLLRAMSLNGKDLPALCNLTLSFPRVKVAGIKLDGFEELESAFLDFSAPNGISFTITNCPRLRSFTLRGTMCPMQRLKKVFVEGVPLVELIAFENHNFNTLDNTRLNVPKLCYSSVSAFAQTDTTSVATLKALCEKWQKACPTGKFQQFPSWWS